MQFWPKLFKQLRSNLIAAVLVVALAALGVFYYATTSVISKAFDNVEQNNMRQQTARVVDTLTNRVDQLQTKATDWASWDDTYQFVENHNAAYIKSNLQSGSLNNLSIHYMLFFNEHQKLVE